MNNQIPVTIVEFKAKYRHIAELWKRLRALTTIIFDTYPVSDRAPLWEEWHEILDEITKEQKEFMRMTVS